MEGARGEIEDRGADHAFLDAAAEIRSLLRITRARAEAAERAVASRADLVADVRRLRRCIEKALDCLDER